MLDTISITVGHADADIIGTGHRALQAAVDYVASLGGGRVRIGPGRYLMRDSLHLRNNVTITGSGEKTVLVKAPAAVSDLVLDGDYGEEQITLADPAGFAVGDGVSVTDDRSGGFHTVVGTLLWRDGDTFGVSKPMNGDYLVSRKARAATTFPVISGYYVEGARIESLAVDGRKQDNPTLTGCRGAGIFLYRCHGAVIHECVVRDYAGDGISFQQSQAVTVESCVCVGNTHLGLHPGSGSQTPTVRDCRSEGNGRIGLFLCWRVKRGVFEDNVLVDNGETGISIGHKDTDNAFRRNRVLRNGREGILFRNESEPMAGHRNLFEDNDIFDNGGTEGGWGVRILGVTHDLTFQRNRIGNRDTNRQRVGISIGERASGVQAEDNVFEGHIDGDVEHCEAAPAAAAGD